VWFGQEVALVGPAIVGNCARLEQGCSIIRSIIGQNAIVDAGSCVKDAILVDQELQAARHDDERANVYISIPAGHYVRWPWYAYAGLPKRMVDVVFAIIILTLFAPIAPIIAIAIKLDSPGPVFFRDRREGRHGRPFICLKFRSMKVGADRIQGYLRQISEVDGPQFKITDDPRITRVGRFLRETYLDELPQFVNVLLGQMSVVGPRPSPRAENVLCPYWRYTRLSVRPGVTGLWQVKRTRQQGRDFQEWIEYDTQYVRQIGLLLDLRICWQTLKKMISKFIGQF
jgi:lipopolysaccharide/colanic/teichoic acid biosynthesis glycosyltransferase